MIVRLRDQDGLPIPIANADIFFVSNQQEKGTTPIQSLMEDTSVSGVSPNGRLVEIIELADHPWFVASQFHPEFRSRPNRPHPLFRDFVRAAFLQSGIDQMELRPAELLEETENS